MRHLSTNVSFCVDLLAMIYADIFLLAGPLAIIEGVGNRGRDGQSSSGYFPPLTTQDCTKFAKIFSNSQPTNGVLSGKITLTLIIKCSVTNLPQVTAHEKFSSNQDYPLTSLVEYGICVNLLYAIQRLIISSKGSLQIKIV